MQLKRMISLIMIQALLTQIIILPQNIYAQNILLSPGTMISLTKAYNPLIIQGLNIYPHHPSEFDFIIDSGDESYTRQSFEEESIKLIKYFLAALTIPENDLWVNLSPYEKDRIIS